MKIDVKRAAGKLGLLGMIIGAVWAADSRIDARVDDQVAPLAEDIGEIKGDIKAIRTMFQDFLLQTASKQNRGEK
ncbi:MAG: hypothetical protein ACE5ER_04325 [Nitrospinaceae bacterium]